MAISKKINKKSTTKKKMPSKTKAKFSVIEKVDEVPVGIKSINIYKKIAFSFIILTIILLITVFYFSFVKLTITIIPSKERLSDSLMLSINDKKNYLQETKKSINGIVDQVEFEESNQYKSTGQEIIGEEGVGVVMMINNYTKNQPLVASTRLLSPDNKLFRIKNTINVPAGGSMEVEVYADKPNESMAIAPTTFTIPGLWAGLQDKIYAKSQEGFLYQKQVKRTILEKDIEQSIVDLKKLLIEKAEKKFGQNYEGFDKVIYSLDDNSISIEIDSKAGEEKENFIATAKASVNIIAFLSKTVGNLAEEKLLVIIPDNKKLVDFNREEMVCILNDSDMEQGQASISVNFNGFMILDEEAEIVDRTKILGLSKAQLIGHLESKKEIDHFEVKFSPAFIDRVPNLVDRIKIINSD
jgi:hypothetical protein